MKRIVKFYPAWDRTDPDPKKNYGVRDIDLRFLVVGKDKAVEFQLSTNWYLEHVMKKRLEAMKHDVWVQKDDFLLKTFIAPYPLDVCYYSPKRLSEDDAEWEDGLSDKSIISCAPIFYGYKYEEEESGYRSPEHAYHLLLEKGEDDLWEYLENYYSEVFGNG